jgi:hypothetical protein
MFISTCWADLKREQHEPVLSRSPRLRRLVAACGKEHVSHVQSSLYPDHGLANSAQAALFRLSSPGIVRKQLFHHYAKRRRPLKKHWDVEQNSRYIASPEVRRTP